MNKRTFLVAWLVLALAKLTLAALLPLFGDEAFYGWEGRNLAWSYSDLPPLTAWLTALGSAILPGELGLRWPFLLLGLLVPWQAVSLARRAGGDELVAWRAGTLSLLLPLSALLGVLALPDVPLLVFSLAAAHAYLMALEWPVHALRPWLWLGAAVAGGLLSHYRFAALPLVMAVLLLASADGRARLRSAAPWAAVGVAALGLLPLLVFNAQHDFAGLRFQLVDRHPWSWQPGGVLQLIEQALVVSPLLFAVFAWAAWRSLRARSPVDGAGRLLLRLGLGMWMMFFVLGFFADNERFRWHWQLPAYLMLLPAVASQWPQLRRWIALPTLAVAALSTAAVFAYLGAAIAPDRHGWLAGKRFPANFSGWREVAAWLDAEGGPGASRLVVDNFMLAAALGFYRDGAAPAERFVLDDALNARHGRAAQLHIWGVDEAALARAAAGGGVLVVEETARRFSDRWPWYQALCARFAGLELIDQLVLHGGRKRFVRWRFDAYAPQPSCSSMAALPPLGFVDAPDRVEHDAGLEVFGWAMQADVGVDAIELLWDGVVAAQTARTIDIGWVEERWGDVGDPAGQRLAFRVVLDTAGLSPGVHRLGVRVRRGDGRDWLLHEQDVRIDH